MLLALQPLDDAVLWLRGSGLEIVLIVTGAVLLQPYVRRGRLLLLAVLVLSALVAATRVLLGVHFVSDVTAGLLIGLGWAALCTAVFATWRAEEGRPVDVAQEGIGSS